MDWSRKATLISLLSVRIKNTILLVHIKSEKAGIAVLFYSKKLIRSSSHSEALIYAITPCFNHIN